MTSYFETYVWHAQRNVHISHTMGDIISGIGIAAADSIGYQEPAQYRSNPNSEVSKGQRSMRHKTVSLQEPLNDGTETLKCLP